MALIVPSARIAGKPTRANRYHLSPTRHSTIFCSKRPMPSLPSVTPIMTNAPKAGPVKLPRPPVAISGGGLLKDMRPRPSAESKKGSQTSHVPA